MFTEEKNNIGTSAIYGKNEIESQDKTRTFSSGNCESGEMVYRNPTYIYPTSAIGDIFVTENKKRREKKISPFNIVLFLFGLAIVSVLYISNILVVGRLLTQINQMQNKHFEIINQQELLKAKINKLSNLDRIQKIAQEELSLQKNKQVPVWIDINPDRIEEVNKVLEEQLKRRK